MTEEIAVQVDEIARMLGVSKDTVYRKAKSGEIPSVLVGNRRRFFKSTVKAKLEQPADDWAYTPRSRQGRRAAA